MKPARWICPLLTCVVLAACPATFAAAEPHGPPRTLPGAAVTPHVAATTRMYASGEPFGEPFDEQGAASLHVTGRVQWTDRDGGLHPVRFADLIVWDQDAGPDDELGLGRTDANGFYSVRVDNDESGGGDIYVEVFTHNNLIDVIRPGSRNAQGEFKQSFKASNEDNPFNDVTAAAITINQVIPNTTDAGNAFGVFDAMLYGQQFGQTLTGVLPTLVVEFPAAVDASQVVGTAPNIYVQIKREDRYDWDVLHHEYGHVVARYVHVDDNPGGAHGAGQHLADLHGKEKGLRLAWAEGWPSFFAVVLQQEIGMASLGIPEVGDLIYRDTEDLNIFYSLETRPNPDFGGEDDEVVVTSLLWDLYDSSNERFDDVTLSFQEMWGYMRQASPKNLSGFWNALTAGKSIREKARYGGVFAMWEVAPMPEFPRDGEARPRDGGGFMSVDGDVTGLGFTWKAGGSGGGFKQDAYVVEIYDAAMTTRLHTSPVLSSLSYQNLTELDWITFGAISPGFDIKWIVKGKNTSSPETGEYVSPAFTVDGGADFAAVIDVSSDMGGALQSTVNQIKAQIASQPNDHTVGYQLASFVANSGNDFEAGPTSRPKYLDHRLLTSGRDEFAAQLDALKTGDGVCRYSVSAGIGAMIFQAYEMDRGGTLFYTSNKTVVIPPEVPFLGGMDLVHYMASALRLENVRFNFLFSNVIRCPLEGSAPKRGGQAEPDALESYARLARTTGGLFAYVPYDADDPQSVARYEHTAANMVQAGLGAAVALVDAPSAPPGSALTVAVEGGKTSFRTGTTLDFGPGITVQDLQVATPTRLQARLVVAPGAAPGFRDVVARTPLGAREETATGVGAFEVTAAPAGPTVLNVTPGEGGLGQTLVVTVDGFGTRFTNASSLDLGAGITVLSATALSDTQLQATLRIDAAAPTGFRDATVTTGSEVAAEDRPGPFLVLASVAAVPAVTEVSPASAAAGTRLDVTIRTVNTTLFQGLTTVDFGTDVTVHATTVLGTTIHATIEIDPAAAPGFRNVSVTSITGGSVVLSNGFEVRATGTDVAADDGLPTAFALAQNYPNPFNAVTTIPFDVAQAGPVRLVVYDVLGREVAVLVDRRLAAGGHAAVFDAAGLPSGVYLYQLRAGAAILSRAMLLHQ